jgi:ABC-type dipeptide/oligopeptide/nickel transport system permease component/ABC-type transport system substrate-binding protein
VKRRLLVIFGGLAAAALGFSALLYAVAALLRPDVSTPPAPPPAAQLAAVEDARERARRLDLANPPVLTRAVDYATTAPQPWWPRGEAPILAELVREGRLPPVARRVGPEPVVMEGVDGIGRYGGTWHRLVNSFDDLKTIYWRLSGSNLVRWSPQGYPLVPHLAKSWEVSPDGRVYTFHLRRGLCWSDGHPVTADDIAFWYEHEVKYFNVQPKFLRAGATQGVVTKVDELRVRFEFAQPNPLFLERLASTGMNYEDHTEHVVPSHYLRRYHPAFGESELLRRTMERFALASPVAAYKRIKHYLNPEHPRLWPWILHTNNPTAPQTLVRNPYYWVVDTHGNQLPYLDRLVLDMRSNNLIGVAAANGEVSMQDRHIRYEDHILLLGGAARHDYEVYHWKPSTQSLFTVFPNLNRRIDPARPETKWKHTLLNEVRFRRALSVAINRRDIIAAEFNGQAEPAQIAPPPDSPYHNARLLKSFTEFDPARANRWLDELGLTQRDAEGFRTFPDGTRMTFTLNLTDYTTEGPAQFVVDDWAAVGVRTLLRSRARRLFEQEKLTYEHDFTVWTGESEFYPLVEPRNFVPTYFESFYAPAFGWWYQYGGLHGDPAAQRPNALAPPLDHPLRRAMQILDETMALRDERERIARFNEVQEIAADNVWTISIATPPPQLVVVKKGFKNVPRTALFGANLQTPANAGIETYFWQQPVEEPAVVAQTKDAITNITPWSADVLEDVPRRDTVGDFYRGATFAAMVLGLLLVGLRHPLIGRRLLLMVPTMFVVSVIVFTLVQLPPGDFAEIRVTRLEMEGTMATEELATELRRNFRLDQPMWQRYARWLGLSWFTSFQAADAGLLQGNLGLSMEHEKPASDVIGDRIVLTVIVSVSTVLFTWLLALPLGIFSAVRPYSFWDYALTFLAFVGVSIPSFLFALVVMYLAKNSFGLNIGGLFSPEYASMPGWTWGKFADLLKHLWLPVVVLGLGAGAGMIRVMRANLLDELNKPYVTTARAKGVRPLRLLLRYPVRMALNPFISSIGGLFPQLVSGGAIVALVLSMPMIGPTLFDALIAEDVYLAASMLMLLSVLGVLGTLVSDLLLLWLDPRIRLEANVR